MNLLYIILTTASEDSTENVSTIREIVSIPFFEVYLSAFLGFLSALIVDAMNE